MSFIKLFIESTKPKIMVQKNLFYFLFGYFISVFYFQHFDILKLIISSLIFISVYSCVYVINDIFDYKRDIHHPLKKHRPIPSNRLNPSYALLLSIIIYIIGFLTSMILINPLFASCIFLLILGNIIYSHPFFKTKKKIVIAALILALLQYLKLLAGWSITAGEWEHPFFYFLIPACLYLYSMLQLLIYSNHYKSRFKIQKREIIIGRSLMIAPAIIITFLLFSPLNMYVIFTTIPIYLAFLITINKLKIQNALEKVNRYMSFLNTLFVSLNFIFFKFIFH